MPRPELVACWLLALAVGTAAEDAARGGRGTWWGAPGLPRQWSAGVERSPVLAVPVPVTRDDRVEQVTLKQTIGIALQHNPRIAARRLEPGFQREGVLQAEAQFDPTLSGELVSAHSRTPSASALSGREAVNVDSRSANVHLTKRFRTGTVATVDFLNERLDTNNVFIALRPQYQPQLTLSVLQPLLRDFGWDFSYLVVRVAGELADAAVYQYEAEVADFVTQVIETYWDVVRARENVAVQRESKALADRTVEENEARVRVGLLPPVATLEARADAASREEQVLIAENALALARQRLAQLAFYRPEGTFVPRTLEPVEEPVEEVHVDVETGIETALAARPEIHASAHGVQARVLDERIAQNALLPRLDLIGSYGVNGLSGTGRVVPSLTARAGANCIPQPEGGFLCTSPFAGPASDAYDRLASNDFRSYTFGLQLQVPLSNAAARSQYSRARIVRSQTELGHRELLSQVTLEVRQAASDVVTSRQRIDTTRLARALAEENLRNQQRRHEVGMATTKDLLDFQARLTSARAAEVQARADHAVAVAHWRRALGQLLAEYQIVLDQPQRESPPWFARF